MKKSIAGIVSGVAIVTSMLILFQNCGPAKVTTSGGSISESAEYGSNLGQQPDSNQSANSTPPPSANPNSTPRPAATPTPTPVSGPALSLSTMTIDFGPWDYYADPKITALVLTNSGNQTLILQNFYLTNYDDFGIENTTCSGTLAPGQSCNISVYFFPFTVGDRMTSLKISANSSPDLYTVTLKGFCFRSTF